MSKNSEDKSLHWFKASGTQHGSDPLLELMKQQQIPLTRQNYLALAYPEGVPEPWPAELEETLPQEIRDKQPHAY